MKESFNQGEQGNRIALGISSCINRFAKRQNLNER